MFYAYIKGLGFIRYLSTDGGVTHLVFFTLDPEEATKWPTEKSLVEEINGDITDVQVLRIEFI